MANAARVVGFLLVLAVLAFLLTPLARPGAATGPVDPWTHVLGRIARGGAPNAEGPYASSYTRSYTSRAGDVSTIVLVDAPDRELALAETLLAARFVREAAFHLRNILAYHGSAPEAAKATDLLARHARLSALDQVRPLSLVLHDGRRLMTSVPSADAGLAAADHAAIAGGRFEEVARRHEGTPAAFALLYGAGRASTGVDRARLYRDALALVQLPALPLVRPEDENHIAVGFVDDALTVAAVPPKDLGSVFFPDSEFESLGAYVANRVYYEVQPGPLFESERKYKERFLVDAEASLGESPDLERARVYWGVASPEVRATFAAPDGELDLAYDRAVQAVPYLRIDAASILTPGPELPVKLDWANLDRVRFRFSPVGHGLPREEGPLKKHLESLRTADLPVAYEAVFDPAPELRLPLREEGAWRVTAESGGLSCDFFAVRVDPRLEAMIFPAETVLLTDRKGLSVSAAGRVLGEEKDGAVRIGPWHGKYCASHAECCKQCESCAHHHANDATFFAGGVQVFACDGRSFFRAKAVSNPAQLPAVHLEPFGPALYVYGDRPVYRAGDTMKFRGILRIPAEKFGRGPRYDVIPKARVVVSIRRDKDTLFKRDYVTGEFGTFSGEFTLPLSSARAEYALQVDFEPSTSTSAPFEVIDYRKSDYVITLASVRGSVAVKAGYAWGAPVEGTVVKAFVKEAETPLKDGRVPAAAGDPVRVVLLRGDEELASKSIVHREPAAALDSTEERNGPAAPPSASGPAPARPTAEAATPALRTAKKVYGRGETIEVEVSGPDGETLVVLGDVMAYAWQRVPIRGGRGVARFPTDPMHDPGVTVFAVIDGSVERLPLEINVQRMRVDVVPGQPAARPGEDVDVTIHAHPGAELSLAAVDEAIFMIREDASPDFYGSFYAPRPAAMAHAVFDGFTYDGASCQAERPPRDLRLRAAVRAGDRVFRGSGEGIEAYNRIGIGGGGGGGGRYGLRFGGRENLVARGGGTRATESAVLAGLKRLAERQQADGSWGPGETSTGFGSINPIGRTALALLSFLGAGYSHLSKDEYGPLKFGETVKNGLTYLLRMQNGEGGIGPSSGDHVMNHALATTALSEAYGMSSSHPYKRSAEAALRFLASRQAGDGGWHPAGGTLGEASVSALAVMALKSGQLAELDYGTAAAMNASRFFRTLTRADGICPANRGPGAAATPLSTASAMLSFMFLAADKKEPRLVGVQSLMTALPDGSKPDFAAWYMGSLALFQYDGPDGPYWKRWNAPLKNALVPFQSPEGVWAPDAPPADTIVMTAFATLTLEVYYRYANVFGGKIGNTDGEEPRPLAPPPAIRVHFPDTALWIPDLVTDDRGEARATVRMPDSITTVRLTSRGVTKDTAVGEGIARIESKQPFFVNLKAPTFFVAGDEAEIRAEIFNYTGAAVETDAVLTGEGFRVLGDSKRRVAVGTSCESVTWRVVIGEEPVRFVVTTDRDVVEKRVPVKPAVAPVARPFRGPVVQVPSGEKPVDLVVRVTPKGSALSKVLDALRFLNEYPHG